MARPTIYSATLLEKAKDYKENWQTIFPDDVLPTIEGLALHIDVARSTIYEWISQDKEEELKEFSDIVGGILEKQGKTLINKGLNNTFNSSITKVMLSKHGHREAVDSDITSGGKSIIEWEK